MKIAWSIFKDLLGIVWEETKEFFWEIFRK